MAHVEAFLPAASAEPPAATRRSIPNLFIGLVTRPRDTLAYLRDYGGRTWVWPALVAIVLTLASQAIVGPIEQEQFEARAAQFQEQTAEAGESVVTQTASASPLTEYGLPVGLLAGGWLVRIGLLFGLSAALGGKGSFRALARMSIWTTLPDITRTLVVTVVSAITGTVSVSGLAFLSASLTAMTGQAGPAQGTATSGVTLASFFGMFVNELLSNLDVYTVWGLILLGMGVAITARMSTIKAVMVTISFWLLGLALAVAPQLLGLGLGRLLGSSGGISGGGPAGGGMPGGGGAPPSGGPPGQ